MILINSKIKEFFYRKNIKWMIKYWWNYLLMMKLMMFENFFVKYNFTVLNFHRSKILISLKENFIDIIIFIIFQWKKWFEYLLKLKISILRRKNYILFKNQCLLKKFITHLNKKLKEKCEYLLKKWYNTWIK